METADIQNAFKEKVCEQVELVEEGLGRFRVLVPFMFDDGDHFAIVLKRSNGSWTLSDEGHTFMHLTYDIDERDLFRGNRQKIVSNALSTFGVEDHEGELVLAVPGDRYGDALFSYVQALSRIADINYISRERIRSTFIEDFQHFMSERVEEGRRAFGWIDPIHDPEGKYPVDCRVNGSAIPLFVFALQNDDRVRDATITLHQFERWDVRFRSVAIFEDQEGINRKVLARFSDVCDKQFSNLAGNADRITRYLEEASAAG